jgi:hypothetical protein
MRRLDRRITRTIARMLAELTQCRLFNSRIAAGWRWWWWKENRKIQMNDDKPRGLLLGHPTRYASAQIAASLTEKGREIFVPLFRRHTTLIKRALQDVSLEERLQLELVLKKIGKRAESLAEEKGHSEHA